MRTLICSQTKVLLSVGESGSIYILQKAGGIWSTTSLSQYSGNLDDNTRSSILMKGAEYKAAVKDYDID